MSASMQAPWRWAAAGAVGGLLIGITLFAPASWLAAGIRAASAGHIQINHSRGTVWSGEGELVLTGGAGSAQAVALPGLVRWKLRPAWSGFQIAVASDCCTPQPLQIEAQWSGAVQIQNGQSHWPASLLTGLGTPWNTVAPQGQLHLRTQDVRVVWNQGAKLQGQIQVDALNIASRLSTLPTMGSYRVTVQGGDAVKLQLNILQGALQLNGQGEWIANRLRFQGEATAAPDALDSLSNLLNIIGRRDGARAVITVG